MREGFSIFYISLSIIVKVAASPKKYSLFDALTRPKERIHLSAVLHDYEFLSGGVKR
jgi:hypothetical protein